MHNLEPPAALLQQAANPLTHFKDPKLETLSTPFLKTLQGLHFACPRDKLQPLEALAVALPAAAAASRDGPISPSGFRLRGAHGLQGFGKAQGA